MGAIEGDSLVGRLAELREAFLAPGAELGRTPACLTPAQLIRVARRRAVSPPAAWGPHLDDCPRCASLLAHYRAQFLALRQPPRWRTTLQPGGAVEAEGRLHLLGFINAEDHLFVACEDPEAWSPALSTLRVNLMIDPACDLLAVTVLEPFAALVRVWLRTPSRSAPLRLNDEIPSFELFDSLSAFGSGAQLHGGTLMQSLRGGGVSLEFELRRPTEDDVRRAWSSALPALLHASGTLERDHVYRLPSGRHTDTYVNLATLCSSDDAIDATVDALDDTFGDVAFDSILAHGWAMGTFARRLAWRRQGRDGARGIHCVTSEGYDQITYSGDLLPASRVLVLSDVNVSGKLLDHLVDHVQRVRANPIAVGAFVEAGEFRAPGVADLRYLAKITPEYLDSAEAGGEGPPSDLRVFNPFTGEVVPLSPQPQSPSDFLFDNEEALALWTLLDRCHAFRHHHRVHHTHYIAYVDMMQLLGHPAIGPQLAHHLRDRLVEAGVVPDALLVPNRTRSQLLGRLLREAFKSQGCSLQLLEAGPRRRGAGTGFSGLGPWQVSRETFARLRAADRVLVLDTAVGHGDTADCLSQIARSAGSASVGVGTILSRLSESCETAFAARLGLGFTRLFNLPIRPVVVRGEVPDPCPVCQRRAAIERVGQESGSEAMRRWADLIARPRAGPRRGGEVAPPNAPAQLPLFGPSTDFLRACRPSTAGGVALHALSAARGGGMAALTLPETADRTIPARNRAAMLEALPDAAIAWSGPTLRHDVDRCIALGVEASVWRAAADLLARSGSSDWISRVGALIDRLPPKRLTPTFFNHLAVAAYIATLYNESARRRARSEVCALVDSPLGEIEGKGVKLIAEVLSV